MTDVAAPEGQPDGRLRPGELIGDRYRLERVAGAGGMATVWRANDERLDRAVALKVISDALAANASAVARFAREARTHARIQHPNLVRVYDYSVASAQPYLVLEYIDGSTLSERLDRGGFSAAAIQTLAVELLSAIACVHDHGVLHRDIKPANVLIDRGGRASLTDFGLARLDDSSRITRPNEVVGTLRFLAPELLQGRPATRQSDLFAFGVLLRSATGNVEPPEGIARLIDWLTEQDPDARPVDAHAALALLVPPPAEDPIRRSPGRSASSTPRANYEAPTVIDIAPGSEPTRIQDPARADMEPTRIRVPARADMEPTRIRDPARADSEPTLIHVPVRGHRARNRLLAVTALAAAAAAAVIAVVTAGGSPSSRISTSVQSRVSGTDVSARSAQPLTIDQHLSQLARAVRRAAAP